MDGNTDWFSIWFEARHDWNGPFKRRTWLLVISNQSPRSTLSFILLFFFPFLLPSLFLSFTLLCLVIVVVFRVVRPFLLSVHPLGKRAGPRKEREEFRTSTGRVQAMNISNGGSSSNRFFKWKESLLSFRKWLLLAGERKTRDSTRDYKRPDRKWACCRPVFLPTSLPSTRERLR